MLYIKITIVSYLCGRDFQPKSLIGDKFREGGCEVQ